MTSNELLNQPVEQVREYWQTVQQRKWLIYFTTLALTLASVVAIALLPDQYQATTTILVDPQKVPDEYVNATIKSPLTERLQTISQEVLSSTRLQEVIDKWNLYPELRQSMSPDQVIDHMRNKIKIDVKRAAGSGPGAFSITYEGGNPVAMGVPVLDPQPLDATKALHLIGSQRQHPSERNANLFNRRKLHLQWQRCTGHRQWSAGHREQPHDQQHSRRERERRCRFDGEWLAESASRHIHQREHL